MSGLCHQCHPSTACSSASRPARLLPAIRPGTAVTGLLDAALPSVVARRSAPVPGPRPHLFRGLSRSDSRQRGSVVPAHTDRAIPNHTAPCRFQSASCCSRLCSPKIDIFNTDSSHLNVTQEHDVGLLD